MNGDGAKSAYLMVMYEPQALSVEDQIRQWLEEFLRGGPDRTEQCLRLGAGMAWVPGKVAEARGLRYGEDYWNAESAPIVDPPRPAKETTAKEVMKEIAVVPNVPGAAGVGPQGSGLPSPDPVARRAAPTVGPSPPRRVRQWRWGRHCLARWRPH
jgi:hypothetical protein